MGLSLLGSTFISRLYSYCSHNFRVYVGAKHAAAVYGGDYYDGDGDGDGDESGGCQQQSLLWRWLLWRSLLWQWLLLRRWLPLR